jgi:hypothetical protein
MAPSKFKVLTLCSLAALFAAGQALAHTGVRDKTEEGKASYNGFTITHGCGSHDGDPYPVLGQSALFPYGADVVWKDPAGKVVQVGGNGHNTISDEVLDLGVTGYAGFSSPFVTSQEIVDDLGNVQALLWKDGAMEPKLNAITPFKITAPEIANNCIKELRIRIGVINYCDFGKNEDNDKVGPYKAPKDAFGRKIPMLADLGGTGGVQRNVAGAPFFVTLPAGNGDDNRADWWFTEPYGKSALYNDPDLLQPEYWTTLTVKNSEADLKKCKGKFIEYKTVEPTGHAFDAYLTGPNTRPFTAGNSNL